MVLLDLVQQSPVTDLEQPRRRFAVPAGLFESGADGVALCFTLHALHQRFQTRKTGLGFVRFDLRPDFFAPDGSAFGQV